MIDHTGHPHPSTPKARALCRANGGTGNIAPKAKKPPAPAKTAPKAAPRKIMNLDTGKVISREEAAKIMFGTKPAGAKVTPKKAPVKRQPRLTDPKIPVAKVTGTAVPEKRFVKDIKVGDRVRGNLIPGEHMVDKIVTSKTDLKVRVGTYSLRDKEGREFFIGSTNSKVTMAADAAPEDRAAQGPSASLVVPSDENISKSAKSGIASRSVISEGAVAQTERVQFKDGSSGIRKVAPELDNDTFEAMEEDGFNFDLLHTPDMQQDAEELGSKLARMMGLRAPEVYRESEDTVVMELMPGTPAAAMTRMGTGFETKRRLVNSDQGILIGLMDQVMGNADRNDGNWLIDGENISAIDHGLAWNAQIINAPWGNRAGAVEGEDMFASNFIQLSLDEEEDFESWEFRDNDVHPDDLDAVGRILDQLKPEFDRLSRRKWFDYSKRQVAELKKYAKGTKRRINL